MLTKALLGARSHLLSISLSLENQIRGLLKTFGRIVPKGAGGLFEKNVRALITDNAEIAAVIMPLVQARQMTRSKCVALDRRLIAAVRGNATYRTLMTMPGIGPITAAAYVAALERPDTFKRSRAVGAWLGLTPRRFQSGEIDYNSHISRRGDGQLQALLYEAAAVLLTRVRNPGRPHPRTPIMRRLHADRGDNPDPGIQDRWMCVPTKIVDGPLSPAKSSAVKPRRQCCAAR
jgi:transposase